MSYVIEVWQSFVKPLFKKFFKIVKNLKGTFSLVFSFVMLL